MKINQNLLNKVIVKNALAHKSDSAFSRELGAFPTSWSRTRRTGRISCKILQKIVQVYPDLKEEIAQNFLSDDAT